jgi:hypothetical protein
VDDVGKAQEEFERFTRNFARVYRFKHDFWYNLRARVDLLEGLSEILGPERTVNLLKEGLRKGRKSSAIPGFSPLSCH